MITPGDMAFRHDIQRLADHGIIKGPVTTWPLAWGPIIADIRNAERIEGPRGVMPAGLGVMFIADSEKEERFIQKAVIVVLERALEKAKGTAL